MEGLEALRAQLESDGYRIEVQEEGECLAAHVSATPFACEECLVPKPMMLARLGQALGVPERSIDLHYPGE